MNRNLRRAAAALIVVPAAIGLTACGKNEAPASTGSGSSASAGASGSAATSDAPAASEGPYKDKASFTQALKSGAATATSAHVSMTMDAAGQKIVLTGDTKVDKDNPAMKVSMDMGSAMKLDMLLVDKKIYMKGMPNVAAGKWAVLDGNSAMGKQLAASMDQADPTRMYDQFAKALTDVKFLGEDSVDGESMDKYSLTIDTAAIAGDLAADSKAGMPKTITYTAWLDDANHLRRVTFDISGAKADMRMSKYGEPVDVEAPAAADTVKAPM